MSIKQITNQPKMKNLLKISALLVSFVLLYSSCTKVQSSMSIDDIPYKATVKGCLVYDMGQGYTNGKYVQLLKPAANVKVTVRVSNDQLDPNGEAQGYTVYTDTTDVNGIYEVTVPSTSEGVEVLVKPETFTGTYSEVTSVEDGNPVIKESQVYYEVNEKTVNIVPGDVAICDGIYTDKSRSAFDKYEYNLSFQLIVRQNSYTKSLNKETSNYVIKDEFVPTKSADVLIDVKYPSGEYKTFGATTNSEGIAQFTIPSKSETMTASINIEVKTFAESKFNFCKQEYDYIDSKYVIKEYTIEGGTFRQIKPNTNYYTSYDLYSAEEVFCTSQKVTMIFHPYATQESYGYDPNDWYNRTF